MARRPPVPRSSVRDHRPAYVAPASLAMRPTVTEGAQTPETPPFALPGPSAATFTVPGDPVPQPRPRIYRNGGVGEDPRAARHKGKTVAAAIQAGATLLAVPVELTLVYHRANYLRVDLDNLAKLTMDALSGVCWRDDSQIVCLQVLKFTGSDNPRTEVIVRAWPPVVTEVADWELAWRDAT